LNSDNSFVKVGGAAPAVDVVIVPAVISMDRVAVIVAADDDETASSIPSASTSTSDVELSSLVLVT
jgi:hypothetical protein